MDETQQDFHEETKQDTEPERRQSEDQDQVNKQRKFSAQEEGLKNSSFKIDETSKETKINSIIRLAKDLRPTGRVVAIVESPAREAKHVVTIKVIDEELLNPNLLHKLNKRQQSLQNDDCPAKKARTIKHYIMGLYAIVQGNSRLPWMQVAIAPKELIADIKDGRDWAARCYVAKIKDW